MERIGLLVIEADPLRREGLVSCLSHEKDITVVGAGDDLIEGLGRIRAGAPPDVVVINADHPDMQTPRMWALLRLTPPHSRILATTAGSDVSLVELLITVGVTVLWRAQSRAGELADGVRMAGMGQLHCDLELLHAFRTALAGIATTWTTPDLVPLARYPRDVAPSSAPARLTLRERQVLALLCAGKRNAEVAHVLGISDRTAAYHVGSILRKLRVSSRLQLALQFRADPTCSSRRSSRPPRRNTRVDLALYTVTPLRSLCHAWTGCSSVPVETEGKRLCTLSEAGHAIVILPSCSSSLLSLPPQLASRPHRSIHKTRTLDHRRPVRGSPQVLFCSMQVVSGNAVPTSRPASTRCTKP